MEIVAYAERESADPLTGEEGILRDEWAVVPVEDFPPGALAEQFGPDWRRTRPFAKYILVHRYIRRGIEEPWIPFDAANTYEQALEYIDDRAVAIDPVLVEIQEGRAEYARQKAEEEESRRLAAIEEEEHTYRKQRSAEAFDKLLKGRSRTWGARWNEFIARMRSNEDFLEWAKQNEEFMSLYTAVLDAQTVPVKVKTIKAFLKKFGE